MKQSLQNEIQQYQQVLSQLNEMKDQNEKELQKLSNEIIQLEHETEELQQQYNLLVSQNNNQQDDRIVYLTISSSDFLQLDYPFSLSHQSLLEIISIIKEKREERSYRIHITKEKNYLKVNSKLLFKVFCQLQQLPYSNQSNPEFQFAFYTFNSCLKALINRAT